MLQAGFLVIEALCFLELTLFALWLKCVQRVFCR